MKRFGQVVSALVPVALLGVIGLMLLHNGDAAPSPRPLPSEAIRPVTRVTWYNGVALAQLSGLAPFIRETGEHPQIVQLYIGLTRPFPEGAEKTIVKRGAMPLFQLNPRRISLAAIAAGRYDSWLREDRRVILALGRPVAISFAHEANGNWFSWGCDNQPAAAFIAAWRHVHDIIGTRDVTWVWTINHSWHGARCPVRERWPGRSYVNWVGIDGYLRRPVDTFATVFTHTIQDVRPFHKPIILTEAGVRLSTRNVGRMASLYAGAHADRLLGVIYFDSATRKGDYRPQDSAPVLARFRVLVSGR